MRSISFEFKRQCVNDACDYLLNETFPFGLSCFPSQIMNSIGAFSGDRVKDTRQEKIVYVSLPHSLSILFVISCCVCNALCI
jgi:hypothetical protein